MSTPFTHTVRSLKHDSSTHALLIIALVLLMLGAWLAWFLVTPVSVYEVSQAARLQVEHASHPVSNAVEGTIVSNRLRLGAKVKQGDILLELAATRERLRLQEEQTRLEGIAPQIRALEKQILDYQKAEENATTAAGEAVEQVRERYNEALAAASFAEENWRRLVNLNSSGQIARIEISRARRETDKDFSRVAELATEIKRLHAGGSKEKLHRHADIQALHQEIEALRAQMATAKATIKRQRQGIEGHIIRAAVAGEIGEVSAIGRGAFIQKGTVLGRIVPKGKLKVIADFVPTRVLGRVQAGQRGHMRLHGFPWAQFGTISVRVEQVASEIRNGRLRVEMQPIAARSQILRHGLSGAVEVEVEKTTPAVLLWRTAGQMLSQAARPAVTAIQIEDANDNNQDINKRVAATGL